MSSNIYLQDFRISYIWFETLLSLLEDGVQKVPASFLGCSSTYEQKFNAIYDAGGMPDKETRLTLPWPTTFQHHFWNNYLSYNVAAANARLAEMAWENFVPLRRLLTGQTKNPIFAERPISTLPNVDFLLEAFYYPHGVALVATARYNVQDKGIALDDAVRLAVQFKKDRHLRWKITQDAPNSSNELSLDTLATTTLDVLHKAWGKGASYGIRSLEPFTIFTVVQGSDVDPMVAVESGGEIHRALESVTKWDDSYIRGSYELTPLNKASISIMNKATSRVLYGLKRTRAIWFPDKFTSTTDNKKRDFAALAAYHRNLVLLSMQVESLYNLVAESKKRLDDPDPLPSVLSERIRRAIELLDHLYTGISTYHSQSAPTQLDNERLEIINSMRTFWNLEPISQSSPPI